jgi:hypothetical protein
MSDRELLRGKKGTKYFQYTNKQEVVLMNLLLKKLLKKTGF